MKRVGVREFRDHATHYLAGDEILAIERHGTPIGYYIPADSEPHRAATGSMPVMARLARQLMAETGLSEDELADLFDLNKPLPNELPRRQKASA